MGKFLNPLSLLYIAVSAWVVVAGLNAGLRHVGSPDLQA